MAKALLLIGDHNSISGNGSFSIKNFPGLKTAGLVLIALNICGDIEKFSFELK